MSCRWVLFSTIDFASSKLLILSLVLPQELNLDFQDIVAVFIGYYTPSFYLFFNKNKFVNQQPDKNGSSKSYCCSVVSDST